MKIFIFLVSFLLLSACASHTQSRAQWANATFGPECEQYGFKRGTEAYGNCILKLMQISTQQSQANATKQQADQEERAMMRKRMGMN